MSSEHPDADLFRTEPGEGLSGDGDGLPPTTPHIAFDSSQVKHSTPVAEVGKSLGQYKLLGVLGEGGFGTVYRAEDAQLRRKIALKVLRGKALQLPEAQSRFLAEARAMAAIQHDNVVPIYAVGEEAGQLFIAMPLLAGETLASRIEREGALPAEEIRRIARETAQGLAAIHAKGLVHRDLKPANIWLEAGSGRVRVLDLGLASDPTEKTFQGGTPAYVSPEQARGQASDARSDLFSLGVVLYECATGKQAFGGITIPRILIAVQETSPEKKLSSSIPADVIDCIHRLMQKDPEQRPASAAEVAKLFPAAAPATARSVRPWMLVAGVALAILGLAVVYNGFATLAGAGNRPKNPPTVPPVAQASVQPAAPLAIEALRVNHFATLDRASVQPRGELGKQSFGAAQGDEFDVSVQLTEPAYSYLIVYRPDGQEQVLYPQDDTDVPELTATPHYPAKRRDERYVLEEGTGLWLVAVVVSKTPLPAYRDWKATREPAPWQPTLSRPSKSETVWWDDGQLFHTLAAGGNVRGSKQNADLEPIAKLTEWLRGQDVAVVQALAFTVK